MKNTASEVPGIPIDYYALVGAKLFGEMGDAVGGVDFNVPVYMNYDAYPDAEKGNTSYEMVRCVSLCCES